MLPPSGESDTRYCLFTGGSITLLRFKLMNLLGPKGLSTYCTLFFVVSKMEVLGGTYKLLRVCNSATLLFFVEPGK